jgi:spore maturation protein CgeB
MREPRILIVGSDFVWSIERFYKDHIGESGIEVRIFPAQNMLYAYLQRSVANKIIHRLGLSEVYIKINNALKKEIEGFNPDIVWVFKGMEVLPATLEWIRDRGIKLANYNPDNPFVFSGRGSGNANVTKGIPFYDLHFTYDQTVREQLQERFNANVHILPFGFEISDEVFDRAVDQQEEQRVCFLGNLDKQRFKYISSLDNADIAVDVYGHNENFRGSKNIRLFPAVYGDEFWMILRRYRVQLNLMRAHNLNSHNMRSFEVPGIGGVGLFPETKDHAEYFKPGENVFLFRTEEDMIVKAKWLLSLSPDAVFSIREKARNYSLEKGYDYRSRALFALMILMGQCEKKVVF